MAASEVLTLSSALGWRVVLPTEDDTALLARAPGKGRYCISFGVLVGRLALEVVDERAAVGKPLDIALNEIGTRCTASERLHMAAVEPRHS